MAKTPKQFHINEVAQVYGSLNDVAVSPGSPLANRRSLDTTTAISEIVTNYFTPDVLKDKDEFLGVVLASIPSSVAHLASKSQQFTNHSSTFRHKRAGKPIFYRYKVFIPELESRCLDLNDTVKSQVKTYAEFGSPLSMAQRINTMTDVGLDVSLYNASEGLRAIQAGTLVKVQFEDLARMKGPKITAIFKKVFDFVATGTTESRVTKFSGKTKSLQQRARESERRDNLVTVPPGDPGVPGYRNETTHAIIVAPKEIRATLGVIYIFPHSNEKIAIPDNASFIPPLGRNTSYYAVFAKQGGAGKASFKTIEKEFREAFEGMRQMEDYNFWPKKIYALGEGAQQVLRKDTDLTKFEQVILADPRIPYKQDQLIDNLILQYNKQNWKGKSKWKKNQRARVESLAKMNILISTNYVEEVETKPEQIAVDVLSKITW
tara:strand:+ start:55 stop:1353 length:1299 start_codon:yes stop_codon:yes gene_type:complete